jgi:transketolase
MTLTDLELSDTARRIRLRSVRLVAQARSSHVGSCLSVADILAVLYGDVLRLGRDNWEDRDRLVMSKGHAAAAVYAALAEAGLLSDADLATYGENGSQLFGHVTRSAADNGIEFSTGSLGHGLPVATGMALTAQRQRRRWRVFTVLSDGEMDEGSNWEAILFAAHHQLDNLVLVVDYNQIQSLDLVANTIGLEPLADKFTAFGWNVVELDGHDIPALRRVLGTVPAEPGKPTAVVARTVKGKGVSFMEGTVLWHYRSPAGEELAQALAEIEGGA